MNAVDNIRRKSRKPKLPKLSLAEKRLFKKLQQAPDVVFGVKRKALEEMARRLESKGYATNRSGHWYPNFYGKVS